MIASIIFCFLLSIHLCTDCREHICIINAFHCSQLLNTRCGYQHIFIIRQGLTYQSLQGRIGVELFPRIISDGNCVYTHAVEHIGQVQFRTSIMFAQLTTAQKQQSCQHV